MEDLQTRRTPVDHFGTGSSCNFVPGIFADYDRFYHDPNSRGLIVHSLYGNYSSVHLPIEEYHSQIQGTSSCIADVARAATFDTMLASQEVFEAMRFVIIRPKSSGCMGACFRSFSKKDGLYPIEGIKYIDLAGAAPVEAYRIMTIQWDELCSHIHESRTRQIHEEEAMYRDLAMNNNIPRHVLRAILVE
ncbi:MAG: hypothetical protein ACOCXT_05665 [Candidatus Dojkabacteria bacterium]